MKRESERAIPVLCCVRQSVIKYKWISFVGFHYKQAHLRNRTKRAKEIKLNLKSLMLFVSMIHNEPGITCNDINLIMKKLTHTQDPSELGINERENKTKQKWICFADIMSGEQTSRTRITLLYHIISNWNNTMNSSVLSGDLYMLRDMTYSSFVFIDRKKMWILFINSVLFQFFFVVVFGVFLLFCLVLRRNSYYF